jgi:hypothetical protein
MFFEYKTKDVFIKREILQVKRDNREKNDHCTMFKSNFIVFFPVLTHYQFHENQLRELVAELCRGSQHKNIPKWPHHRLQTRSN